MPDAVSSARIVAATASRDSLEENIRELATYAILTGLAPESDIDRAQVILDYIRETILYVQDPVNADRFQAPKKIAYLISHGRPVSGDCADHVGFFAAMTASIGIPSAVVLQTDVSPKPHLIAAIKINDRWIPVDVTDHEIEIGETRYVGKEIWIPLPGSEDQEMGGQRIEHVEDTGATYIGVGAASATGTVALATTREQDVGLDSTASGDSGWLWGMAAGLLIGGLLVWACTRSA